jgi:hypothetical protein
MLQTHYALLWNTASNLPTPLHIAIYVVLGMPRMYVCTCALLVRVPLARSLSASTCAICLQPYEALEVVHRDLDMQRWETVRLFDMTFQMMFSA